MLLSWGLWTVSWTRTTLLSDNLSIGLSPSVSVQNVALLGPSLVPLSPSVLRLITVLLSTLH